MQNDLTLLKLKKQAILNEKVQVACLPEKMSSSYPSPNTQAYAIGWGRTTPRPGSNAKELRNTLLTVLNDTECSDGENYTPESKICAVDLTNMDKSECKGNYEV